MIVSTIEEVKAAVSLTEYAREKLEPSGGGKFVCPVCGSGKGPNGTGALSLEPGGERWRCFACEAGGDVLDLAGAVTGAEGAAAQARALCDWAGLGYRERDKGRALAWDEGEDEGEDPGLPAATEDEGTKSARKRERGKLGWFAQIMERGTKGHDYMLERGFTADEIERFGFGWNEEERRVTVPWPEPWGYYHQDRYIGDSAGGRHKYDGPKASEVGEAPVFASDGALDDDVAFVVEGPLDAYALMACGVPCIALAGASNHKRVAEYIAGKAYGGVVVIIADPDEAGRASSGKLAEGLRGAGVPVVVREVGGFAGLSGAKDPCEALQRDREALVAFLGDAAGGANEAAFREAVKESDAVLAADVAGKIMRREGETDPVPTGIGALDSVLGGGLRCGLCVLGAASSLGKTTLALQIADTVSASGVPVLFVTIEQSARELVAKSLARRIYQTAEPVNRDVTARDLMDRTARDSFNPRKNEHLEDAVAWYSAGPAKNLVFMEPSGEPSVKKIACFAREVSRRYGRPPMVFIDYLQLLGGGDSRADPRTIVNKSVTDLRVLAKDLGACVFCIASLNRGGYKKPVTMESFKESGGIEYGADVLMGLQPAGIGRICEEQRRYGDGKPMSQADAEAATSKALQAFKGAPLRGCEVVVLKNRSGAVPQGCAEMTFNAPAGLFTDEMESGAATVQNAEGRALEWDDEIPLT